MLACWHICPASLQHLYTARTEFVGTLGGCLAIHALSSLAMTATVRDGGRDDRLNWSKRAEHRLREELKEIALKKCDESVAKFAVCARDKGMWVVFSCREQNRQMNECLHRYTNKDGFEQYKLEREVELHRANLE